MAKCFKALIGKVELKKLHENRTIRKRFKALIGKVELKMAKVKNVEGKEKVSKP